MINLLPEFVTKLRINNGLTLKDVSHKMRLLGFKASDVTIANVEQGRTASPSIELMAGFSKVFNRPLEDFAMAYRGIDPDTVAVARIDALKAELETLPIEAKKQVALELLASIMAMDAVMFQPSQSSKKP